MVRKLKDPVTGGGLGVLKPTVSWGQLEMFGSVEKVLALAVREGLNDVAEVTVHHNQPSVNRRNRISGQRLWFWKGSLLRPQFPPTRNDTVGFDHWFLTLLWDHAPLVENLMQSQPPSPERCTCTTRNALHNFGIQKAYRREAQKVLERLYLGQLILTKDGRTRIPKSLPNPNLAFDKS